MKSIHMLSLSLVIGLTAGTAAGQEIANLVRIDAANKSASPAVTRSIADYIAKRNSAESVQAMARARPDSAPSVTVESLLAAIESNAGIVEPAPTPAAVAPPQEPEQPPSNVTPKRTGGSQGGGGGGGGAGGGGGGGWK